MTRQTADVHTAFHTLAENFAAVFGRGDAAGVAAFYSDDGMLLPSGTDFVRGKRAIEAFWREAMEMGIRNARIDIQEVERHGDTAIEVSKYTLSDADNQVMDHGKGIVIWKHEDGGWKMHRDIWTSSMAPQ
jgi:uncharacterized protein (TIGR02246 family)